MQLPRSRCYIGTGFISAMIVQKARYFLFYEHLCFLLSIKFKVVMQLFCSNAWTFSVVQQNSSFNCLEETQASWNVHAVSSCCWSKETNWSVLLCSKTDVWQQLNWSNLRGRGSTCRTPFPLGRDCSHGFAIWM